MKDFALQFSLILIMIHIFADGNVARYGIYDGCPMVNHFIYIFVHGGWLHLLCNIFFLLEMGFFATSVKWYCWVMAMIIAMLTPAFSNVPVVGFSGVLYALSGFAFCFSKKKMRPLIILSALVLFQFLTGGIAVMLHLICFSAALIIGMVVLPIREIKI